MSNIRNIKKAVGNTVAAATSVVAVSTEVIADGSGLISSSIGATPAVLKALLKTPFSAAKGYIMETTECSEAEAELVAFKYLKQDVSTTIDEFNVQSGKLIAQLLEEEADEASAK